MRSWLYVDISEKSHRVTFFQIENLEIFFCQGGASCVSAGSFDYFEDGITNGVDWYPIAGGIFNLNPNYIFFFITLKVLLLGC